MAMYTPYGESRIAEIGPTPVDLAEHVRDLPRSLQELALAETVAHFSYAIKLGQHGGRFRPYDNAVRGQAAFDDYLAGVHNDTTEHTPLRDLMASGKYMPVRLGRDMSQLGWNLPVKTPDVRFYPLDAINVILDVPENQRRPAAFTGYIAMISVTDSDESGILLAYDDRPAGDDRVGDPTTYGVAGPSLIVDAAKADVRRNPDTFINLYHTIFPGADRSKGALSVAKVIDVTLNFPQSTPRPVQPSQPTPTQQSSSTHGITSPVDARLEIKPAPPIKPQNNRRLFSFRKRDT